MRTNIYFTDSAKARASKLAELLNLPLSRLFAYLVEYYIRKEKIIIED